MFGSTYGLSLGHAAKRQKCKPPRRPHNVGCVRSTGDAASGNFVQPRRVQRARVEIRLKGGEGGRARGEQHAQGEPRVFIPFSGATAG
jgi:hypothetical protein